MSSLFLLIMVIVLIKSPLGRALADRLAGRIPDGRSNDLEPVVRQLEDRVLDLEDRLDFAEGLIEQQKHRDRLKAD